MPLAIKSSFDVHGVPRGRVIAMLVEGEVKLESIFRVKNSCGTVALSFRTLFAFFFEV